MRDRWGPWMSELTERIKAYKAGKVSWEDLKRFLREYPYNTPTRLGPARPTDPWELFDWLDNLPLEAEEGTHEEVDAAYDAGLLTLKEWQEVGRS